MTTKFFIDSADTDAIEVCLKTGLIDGVTTNPTLIRKSGKHPYHVYEHLINLGVSDISMEVSGTAEDMHTAGTQLSNRYGSAATIKLPMTVDGLEVCKSLANEGIKTNVTLIFNAAQALLAAKAGATYVSPFVGRIDDQGYAGTEVVRSISELLKYRSNTLVLAASIRTTQRVVRCIYNGADAVTMPPSIFWQMYEHVLTDKGLEMFERDLKANN